MKIGFWVGYIKNLVLKLRQTACEKKVIIQVVSTALVLVVAYCTQSFFFSSEPLNSLIGRIFGDPVSQNSLNGESIPRYLLLGPVFGALLLWAVITVWSLKLGFRLGILVIAALLGLIMTPFLAQTIEYVLNLINCGMRFGETSTSDSCTERHFANIQNNLPLLAMSLPVLLLLWIFRTYDIRQQIEKTQKQIEEATKSREMSTYNNLLAVAMNMLVSDKVEVRRKSLVQLALVRHESPELKNQIDIATQNLILYQEERGEFPEEVIKLSGAMLQNLNLKGAIMKKAQLLEADLRGANLVGADLREANLMGADLRGAHLEGANLEGAHLEGAHLEDAILEGANLTKAELMGAQLTGANLERAILIEAVLVATPLLTTNLERVNLKGARLDGAYLSGAVLVGAELTKSDLPLESSLTWLDNQMRRDLRESDLGGANLKINLTFSKGADFTDAKYDQHTDLHCIQYFDPKAEGMIKVD